MIEKLFGYKTVRVREDTQVRNCELYDLYNSVHLVKWFIEACM